MAWYASWLQIRNTLFYSADGATEPFRSVACVTTVIYSALLLYFLLSTSKKHNLLVSYNTTSSGCSSTFTDFNQPNGPNKLRYYIVFSVNRNLFIYM